MISISSINSANSGSSFFHSLKASFVQFFSFLFLIFSNKVEEPKISTSLNGATPKR